MFTLRPTAVQNDAITWASCGPFVNTSDEISVTDLPSAPAALSSDFAWVGSYAYGLSASLYPKDDGESGWHFDTAAKPANRLVAIAFLSIARFKALRTRTSFVIPNVVLSTTVGFSKPTAVATFGTLFAESGGRTVTRLTSPAFKAETRVLRSGIARILTVWIVAVFLPQ